MLLTNLRLATNTSGYGLIEDGAIQLSEGRIAWIGERARAPKGEAIDCGGRLATPGLIDCHTHLVHGGNRANEFEMRLNGVAYADIARAGDGIMATVRATRAASEAELLVSAARRLDCLLAEGVTTVEIKSGYGLDVETEVRMLRVARKLAVERKVDVVTSFLGAHALPAEYRD
ncbi:MAG: imidazolonepropionase, partial [Alphaproteobacteria bacterium]|nr:imidazolonepropionase [Alphaproteobacteria bacterium]